MLESSRDMEIPRYSRCRDIVGTRREVFGPTKTFPRRRRGSNPGPPAQEASALTTRLPRFLRLKRAYIVKKNENSKTMSTGADFCLEV